MADDPWLKEFRDLHERAGKDSLTSEERRVYAAAKEQLARTLAKVQGLTQRPGQTARQSFRVALALQIDLTPPSGSIRAVTLDVGRGGFSAMLQQMPGGSEPVAFQVKMPAGAPALTGRARIVDTKKQVGNFRISFAFVDLPEAEGDRIERILFDSVLARLG